MSDAAAAPHVRSRLGKYGCCSPVDRLLNMEKPELNPPGTLPNWPIIVERNALGDPSASNSPSGSKGSMDPAIEEGKEKNDRCSPVFRESSSHANACLGTGCLSGPLWVPLRNLAAACAAAMGPICCSPQMLYTTLPSSPSASSRASPMELRESCSPRLVRGKRSGPIADPDTRAGLPCPPMAEFGPIANPSRWDAAAAAPAVAGP
mmetsp:Transcript_5151/g.9762  ORF Transcript_5151/g.9762 Transcript_5151/m.9762 type:complete len:206 (+) Transcript_5151:370-987(+)